jgi:hypothetical protein
MRQSQYGIPDRLTSDVSSGRYRSLTEIKRNRDYFKIRDGSALRTLKMRP